MKTTPMTGYQKFVLALLAFLQFTIILDFMIMSPLGAILMPALRISPTQFGIVVSAYAFSAGIAGFLAAGFADRYDRKKLLLFFYVGFLLGTLFCGLAPNYELLLIARIVTGLFGGVIGAIVLAITTDLFPFEMRGRVMGILQTAFGASQILGIPAGLFFSNLWGWHAPFMMIVAIGSLVGVFIWLKLKPVDGHLSLQTDRNPLHHLLDTLTTGPYLAAYACTALLSIGGYMLMPFGSAFTVNNLGIQMSDLPMVYLITGICAILMGPLVGRLSDRFGKFNIFLLGTLISISTVIYYTHMGKSTLLGVVLINVVMFVGVFSRMIPSQALISAIPTPGNRGAFMAVSSSLQQVAGGVASVLAGMLVTQQSDGTLVHFEMLGYAVSITAVLSLMLMRVIHRRVPENQ